MPDPNLHALRAASAEQDGDHVTATRERELAEQDAARELLIQQGILQGEVTVDENLKQRLKIIAEATQIRPKVVYNPGSGPEVAPAVVFPEARTIFLDIDPSVAHNLHGRGFEGYAGDMHNFTLPDGLEADIVLLLNTDSMTEPELDGVTRQSGLVIVNNYGLGTDGGGSDYMQSRCPGYELIGAGNNDGYAQGSDVAGSDLFRHDNDALYVYQRRGVNAVDLNAV
jgi:hypothetical protein